MLKKFKMFMLNLVWSYYHDRANYYYRKMSDCLTEDNARWDKKAQRYVKREIEAYSKLMELRYGEA